jgi:hypothetical protein
MIFPKTRCRIGFQMIKYEIPVAASSMRLSRRWICRKNSFLAFWMSGMLIIVSTLCSADCLAQIPQIMSSKDFVLTPAQASVGIDGRVKVGLDVDESGLVADVTVMAGPIWPCEKNPKKELEEFKDGLIQTARTFRFAPAMKDGQPIKSVIILTITVGEAYKKAVKEGEAAKAKKSLKDQFIDAGIVNGRAIKLPKPSYPLAGYNLQGSVLVDVIINEEGYVISAGTIWGPKEFHKAARGAACEAKFSPTTASGIPVKVTGRITYNFIPYRRR